MENIFDLPGSVIVFRLTRGKLKKCNGEVMRQFAANSVSILFNFILSFRAKRYSNASEID